MIPKIWGDTQSTVTLYLALQSAHSYSEPWARGDTVSCSIYLLQDILLPHEFLPLPVGLGHGHVHHDLPGVGRVHHEEHQVLQQLDGKPVPATSQRQMISWNLQ